MDTSKEYIKMCHCHEIQVLKHYSPQMWTNPISLRKNLYIDRDGNFWHICQQIQAYLPRLDELIDMIDYYIRIERKGGTWTVRGFSRNLRDNCKDFHEPDGSSLEKLLLRLYMWQKYNKLWKGKKWTLVKNIF